MNVLTRISLATAIGVTAYLIVIPKTLALTITDTVSGTNSLYYEDWGHSYNIGGGGNQLDAVGRGDPAEAFGDGFAFVGNSSISIDVTASNCTIDAGQTCTGPDGRGGIFRGLPTYSLIGIWSSNSTNIENIGNSFFIGSNTTLFAPDTNDDVFLFLATNDGIFADNGEEYTVSITVPDRQVIPAPTAILPVLSSLLMKSYRRKTVK